MKKQAKAYGFVTYHVFTLLPIFVLFYIHFGKGVKHFSGKCFLNHLQPIGLTILVVFWWEIHVGVNKLNYLLYCLYYFIIVFPSWYKNDHCNNALWTWSKTNDQLSQWRGCWTGEAIAFDSMKVTLLLFWVHMLMSAVDFFCLLICLWYESKQKPYSVQQWTASLCKSTTVESV